MARDPESLRVAVRERYAGIARQAVTDASPSGCGCGCSPVDRGMTMVEYGGAEKEAGVVDGANLGLGCGIPTQHADIREGQTVLDLGSGAGVDVFMAASRVGPAGRVIGVDMTPEMITLARENASKGGYQNVEFRLAEIEHLPVPDASVDVVLSNCVINLVPDKSKVYAEIHRVLRPGGTFTISDVVSWGEVPEEVRDDLAAYTGCVAGAMDGDVYLALIRQAGFEDVRIASQQDYDLFAGQPYGVGSVTLVGRKRVA